MRVGRRVFPVAEKGKNNYTLYIIHITGSIATYRMITTKDLRKTYLNFFKTKEHAIVKGSSLVPENDPTVLFTTAGMHPLVPYLLGEEHPAGKRLANCQKCIRTTDIDEVGDNTHLTFFEMLGNWSLGDYFKKEAIAYSWEFLISPDWLGLNPAQLAVSVFAGDRDAPRDQESAEAWRSWGVPKQRIAYLGKKDNWWGPAGKTGPCGPDTEMFYWTGSGAAPERFDPGDERWVEIWNDVFMQYNKSADGAYEPLQQKNVDTGMGLERVVAVLNGFSSVYEVDTVRPVFDAVKSLAGGNGDKKILRVIADHVRAAVVIMGDDKGIVPSNVEQGYIVRRLIRSSIRRGREIGIRGPFIAEAARAAIETLKDPYRELGQNAHKIISELTIEEKKFGKVLVDGEKKVKEFIARGTITGEEAFVLYATYGFPVEEIERLGVKVDMEEFQKKIAEHQELSRAGSTRKFSGGLADHSEEVKKLHTATHLLHAALRSVLGDHVAQKGSNITHERLRFDFSYPEKMTGEQIKQVENVVNEQIKKGLPVSWQEMTVAEAKKAGAVGLFAQKYGEKVKVYTIGDSGNPFSREICGGPHVANTSELGHFKIIKEQASSAGIRRIKAVLE